MLPCSTSFPNPSHLPNPYILLPSSLTSETRQLLFRKETVNDNYLKALLPARFSWKISATVYKTDCVCEINSNTSQQTVVIRFKYTHEY